MPGPLPSFLELERLRRSELDHLPGFVNTGCGKEGVASVRADEDEDGRAGHRRQ